MELVEKQGVDAYLERYSKARDGVLNENTESEAMFVMVSQYGGAYLLTTGREIMWTGIGNASARLSDNGQRYSSVQDALRVPFDDARRTGRHVGASLYYSEDLVSRLTFLAELIAKFKADPSFLLIVED